MAAQICITDFVKSSDIEQRHAAQLFAVSHLPPCEVASLSALPIPCLDLQPGDDVPELARSCRGILAYHTLKLDDAFLSQFPHLEILVRVGVGFDNADLEAATRRGIVVTNLPDYGTDEVSDAVFGHILNLTRKNIVLANRTQEVHRFDTRAAQGSVRLRGRTLGVVGLGAIGTAVALKARAFGLKVAFYDPYVGDGIAKAFAFKKYDYIDDLLQHCDIVSLNCPLNKETYHMLNEERLRKMKTNSILINTARGGIVDERALARAVRHGDIAGAGLDVLETEPSVPDDLLGLENIIITPHSAFYTEESYVELRTKGVAEVVRVLAGFRPRNPVNKHLGIYDHPRWKDKTIAKF